VIARPSEQALVEKCARGESRTLEMHHIRYFLAVSETLNLTKAAERCDVAQPALSRAIKDLETELGGELFRRERALSHLTELGQRVLPMLRQSYETALAAKKVAASIRKGEGAPLSLAVSHTLALARFIPMLRELSRAFPGLQLKLHRGSGSEVAEFLKSGAAELAIAGPLDESWSRLDAVPLFEERFGLVVGWTHRLAGSDKVEFKELASENLVINTGCEMVEELRACLEANGLVDTAAHQVTTQEDLLALLKADLGVAITPIEAVETNGLCRIALKQLSLARKVSVYTVAGRHRAVVSATLFNMLRAADWGFDTGTKQQRRAHR
jgi:DNA-binding transcriptional LysR family regulator